jgi:hypothetical protein
MHQEVATPERQADGYSFCGCRPGTHKPDRVYFVTVRDAGRTGFLLGPYSTHEEAINNVQRGKKAALDANSQAWFYAYGTASLSREVVGKVKTVFGS